MHSSIGANIKRLRRQLGWSQTRLAYEVCRSSGVVGEPVGRQEVSRWETGKRTPREWLPFIAKALGVPVSALTRAQGADASLLLPTTREQRRDDYAQSIRSISQRLIALDNELHGLPIAASAVRAFATVHRRLGEGDYEPRYEREIRAAAAELAEIANWALFNEGNFKASRRYGQEAIFLAKLAGDRSTELITLQNLGMLAGWTGRAREELAIAGSVLDQGGLSPRVEALFRAREGQGLAGSGRATEAERVFDKARSLLQDSAPGTEPSWAWWVSDQEIDRQQGRILHETGRYAKAIPLLERAMEADGAGVGYANVARVRLLDSLLQVEDWWTAEQETLKLMHSVREMASVATLNILERVVDQGRNLPGAPRSLREALHEIESTMRDDPYEI
ncbi:helix-turn-helix transcriptional regulator [Streptomyces sp. MUM 203J]|uniref:helix-turn-helix transcriptional regulator n=1 Tax=Streptomyces sp. MUM 203J TaxID=2791990 RepID=UPI001F0442A9|nr:helix-turn-helix transcriptional regulator [Streptomyces sp. MUM 203J]MCH0539619.1 helix-turn-helix transcriptional regulator [Streptomyces sp. MUM 203J]